MLRQRSGSIPSFCATSCFGGIALQSGGEFARGGFHLFVAAAHVARGPIELAQAVENRALDAVLGVAREGNLFFGIEFAGGVEQAEDSGVNQIVDIDVDRQVFVDANGDGFDEGQVLQHHAVAAGHLGVLLGRLLGSGQFRGGLSFGAGVQRGAHAHRLGGGLSGGLGGAAPLRDTARSLLLDAVLVLIWCGGSWSAGATAAALELFSLISFSPTPLKRHALGQTV